MDDARSGRNPYTEEPATSAAEEAKTGLAVRGGAKVSGYVRKKKMDRNLGAPVVCEGENDARSGGGLIWG
ncbi:LD-carboxypeptidase [Sesbania bispinosa]|nr:LD-carboxypeptidase [Sesbania bispinosa]